MSKKKHKRSFDSQSLFELILNFTKTKTKKRRITENVQQKNKPKIINSYNDAKMWEKNSMFCQKRKNKLVVRIANLLLCKVVSYVLTY